MPYVVRDGDGNVRAVFDSPVDGAELSDLQWVTLADAMKLDLPSVTRFMLGEIAERLAKPHEDHRPPYLRWTRKGHQTDRL